MFRKVRSEGDVDPIHNCNTRNAHLQRPSLHRLTGTQHAISFMGPSLWNGLPARISGITGFFRFKRSLKAHFLSSYDSYQQLCRPLHLDLQLEESYTHKFFYLVYMFKFIYLCLFIKFCSTSASIIRWSFMSPRPLSLTSLAMVFDG